MPAVLTGGGNPAVQVPLASGRHTLTQAPRGVADTQRTFNPWGPMYCCPS
jgi:hypothetical protein